MKKVSTILFCAVFILQCMLVGMTGTVNAADTGEYKPLDMVVVVDTSGSMNTSDSTHMTAKAINMLINMMPAEESRIGIVTFNTKAVTLSADASGKPALLPLAEFDNVKAIKGKVNGITYDGGTGIGNALKAATDLLTQQSSGADRQKAILLFTDGMDDFGTGSGGQLGLALCKENQAAAVQWAADNNCPIYCIGYNYQNSMGPKGEGITKLESIAKSTGGQAKAITNIQQIEDMFVHILANICDLYYKDLQTVPGDGKRHEIEIPISPAVVEANIRITCSTQSALSNGKIELYNPAGEIVRLQNGNGVRYDVDATAASIKVIAPKTGTWKLVLEGIKGEAIQIGLLEHYDLGIVSQLILPEGNPQGVAYPDDEIGVQAYLTKDGSPVADTAIYDSITDARVVVVPRAAPEQQAVYALSFDGTQYTGSFPVTMESTYDITVELASSSFIRSESFVLQSSNHPLVLDKSFDNVKLNKKKQVVIPDIYTYVSDPEQDQITAEITNSTDPDMAKVEIKDDTIVIDGLGWGATNVTVTFTDAHGNTVSSTFKVSVNDPVAWAIIISILLLIVLLVLWLTYLGYKKTILIGGTVKIKEIGTKSVAGGIPLKEEALFILENFAEDIYESQDAEEDSIESIIDLDLDELLDSIEETDIVEDVADTEFDERAHHAEFDSTVQLKQCIDKNFYSVLEHFVQQYEDYMTLNGMRTSEMAEKIRLFVAEHLSVFKEIEILGTRFGRQGIVFKLDKKSELKLKGFNEGVFKTCTSVNETTKNIEFAVPKNEKDDEGGEIFVYVKFDYRNGN